MSDQNEHLHEKTTQLKISVNEDLHVKFKAACTVNKVSMQDCISRFMQMIVDKSGMTVHTASSDQGE